MATRFNPGNGRYLDTSGAPLSGGKLRFKATGSDTLKDSYSDLALTTPNTNPVVLDANGNHGDIFLDGAYRVELLTSADVELWEKDPVGGEVAETAFADWAAGSTYAIGAIVTGSDGAYYRSITASNSGNDPTSSAANWSVTLLLGAYNTNQTYVIGDLVQGSDDRIYRSLTNPNTGNAVTDRTNWKPSEEISGTFTPVVWDASLSDAEGQTYTTQVGFYTLIGNRVFFNLTVRLSSKGTLTAGDQVRIGGLPYAHGSATNCYSVINPGTGSGYAITAGTVPGGQISPSASHIEMGLWDSTTGQSALLVSEITTSGNIVLAGQYPI